MLKSTNGLSVIVRNHLRIFPLTLLLILLLGIVQSCSGLKHKRLQKKLGEIIQEGQFNNHHSGFLVLDPQSGDTLYKRSAARYFIPASNVKIFTLYASLQLIPEKIPALQYTINGDTLYFEGQGDPSALHPLFKDSTALKFISTHPVSVFVDSNFKEEVWPAGWSWEDFDRYFAPERSSFPLYGNVIRLYSSGTNPVLPAYFRDSVSFQDTTFKRLRYRNQFHIPEDAPDSLEIPLKLRPGLQAELLEAALGRKIEQAYSFPSNSKKILYGIYRDTILQQMMYESDNFLAEQLLLVASSTLSDTLSSRTVINHILESELPLLKQPPRWVDGSGLSRYNLFTPESIVKVLDLLYSGNDFEVLRQFFPAGGISGTLKDDYKGQKEPYLFAKSGSMGNIYCISGYLEKASGKILIFSFMNNNFRARQSEIRNELRKVLETLRDTY